MYIFKRLGTSTSILIILIFCSSTALNAIDICPVSSAGFAPGQPFTPAISNVNLTLLSAIVSEDIDTDLAWFTDRADIYGKMQATNDEVNVPLINGSDNPHWTGGFSMDRIMSNNTTTLKLNLYDQDGDFSGDDDHVDLNPSSSSRTFLAEYNICANTIKYPDNTVVSAAGVITAIGDASSGNERGSARLRVETTGGRPPTVEDVYLVEVSPVQVIHRPSRLVAGKPMVLMARVANNFDRPISTSIAFEIEGPDFSHKETFQITPPLNPGEVRRMYFRREVPLIVPNIKEGQRTLSITARIDPLSELSSGLPADDCRRRNDYISENARDGLTFKIVETRLPLLFWLRVGRLITLTTFATEAQLQRISGLGSAFIEATYPTPRVNSFNVPFGYLSPVSGIIFDIALSVFRAVGIPADSVAPFITMFELNYVAAIAGIDRIMGIVSKTYFEEFLYGLWEDTPGASLTSAAPRAVLISGAMRRRAGDTVSTNEFEPSMALTAHELGHTYGLSVDPVLKDSPLCGIEGEIATIICGIDGGFDEYENPNPDLTRGNPASGFWVRPSRPVPAEISTLVDKEQCNTSCLMGNSPRADFMAWDSRKRWIDTADYEALIDELATLPDPETVVLAGVITHDDQVALMPFYTLGDRVPDLDESTQSGIYRIRMLDVDGKEIQNVGLKANWATAEFPISVPLTYFVQVVPFPKEVRKIQFVNAYHDKIIAERDVSRRKPKVEMIDADKPISTKRENGFVLSWKGSDKDLRKNRARRPDLWYSVMVKLSPKNSKEDYWFPIRTNLKSKRFKVNTKTFEPGEYKFRVMVTDGVNSSKSEVRDVTILD